VAEAGPRTSRIQLLDDPGPRADDARLRAAVRVFRPGSKEEGAEGVLSGERRDLLRVRMLPAGAAVPGDLVVTSGADPLVPEGLVVGRVLDAGEDGSPKLAAAHVAPSADLAGLREVFVLVAPEADVRAERGAKR
jgi:cell shape-determining protein MreC